MCFQVVHTIFKESGPSTIFVIDYTKRVDLLPPPSERWSKNFYDMIVTINLRSEQSRMAKYLPAGTFCTIKDLRVQPSEHDKRKICGLLTGNGKAISKLNPKHSEDERFLELRMYAFYVFYCGSSLNDHINHRREDMWENSQPVPISRLVDAERDLGVFNIRARVVKLYPAPVEHCVGRYCKKCHNRSVVSPSTALLLHKYRRTLIGSPTLEAV